jgi:hypothetical protein
VDCVTYELHHHDARNVSELLEPESVDLIVTSPPYFALRSYRDGGEHYDGQLGSEPTPSEFVDALIACTADWLKVLRPGGSLWVNLGDKYSGGNGQWDKDERPDSRRKKFGVATPATIAASTFRHASDSDAATTASTDSPLNASGRIPPKSLMGLPWRYALRCIDELGLILRAEVIWSKPNGLPESVTDRVRRSHEQWFHFTRQGRYFAAIDEVREAYSPASLASYAKGGLVSSIGDATHPSKVNGGWRPGESDDAADWRGNPLGKAPGSVWTIPSEPLVVPDALGVDHFAAFPSEWPRRIILGWSPSGYCTACDEPRRAVVASRGLDMTRPQARRAVELADAAGLTDAHLDALESVGLSDVGRALATNDGAGKNDPHVQTLADEARAVLKGYAREYLLRRPTSFSYACACPTTDAPTRPAVVLDPFAGTGTTVAVAHLLGRHGIGTDLSRDYLKLAEWRCASDQRLRDKVLDRSGIPNPKPPAIDGQLDIFAEGLA